LKAFVIVLGYDTDVGSVVQGVMDDNDDGGVAMDE
jgi:hypothetical protein